MFVIWPQGARDREKDAQSDGKLPERVEIFCKPVTRAMRKRAQSALCLVLCLILICCNAFVLKAETPDAESSDYSVYIPDGIEIISLCANSNELG
ncbi:MAG: hypothetical protein FWE66_04590, partial [Oscillospiraceae bacterium]|nr:hypothetical protein [Oscillospiraceae bacterium]